MKTLLVFLLFFGLKKCQSAGDNSTTNETSYHVTNVQVNAVGTVFTEFFGTINAYLKKHTTDPNPVTDDEAIPATGRNVLFYIIVALILLLLLICIVTCCLIFILLLCWQRRRQQKQKKQADIERIPATQIVSQTPNRLILPPPQNNKILLKSPTPTPLLHRQPEVPHSPITLNPEVVGFRPIQPSESKKNSKSQNPDKPKQKRSSSEDPKLKKTIDAQRRTDTSSNISSSTVSSPTSIKAKTPRQDKNGAISNKGIQTDLDSSDEEEYQNRVRGNETMPGRNIPSPRKELLV